MTEVGHDSEAEKLQIHEEIRDDMFESLVQLFPRTQRMGRPYKNLRGSLSGLRFWLVSECNLREIPSEFGKFQTIYGLYRKLKRSENWDLIFEILKS